MNKYSKYFNEDMTEEEIRRKYYSLMDKIPRGAIAEIEELEKAYIPVRDIIMERECPVNQYSKFFNENMSSNSIGAKYFSLIMQIRKNGGSETDLKELNKAYYPVRRKIDDRDSTMVYKGWIID